MLTTPVEQGSYPYAYVTQKESHAKKKEISLLRRLSSVKNTLPGFKPSLKMDGSNGSECSFAGGVLLGVKNYLIGYKSQMPVFHP